MKKTIIMGMIAAMALLSTGCDDKLEVQQMYEFSVTTLPLQAKIGIIESVKMQFKLIRAQKYDSAKYYFNFFQTAGYGFFSDVKNNNLSPNVNYELKGDTLSLYYTSFCVVKQTIDVTIRDNFNQEHKLTFNFEHDPKYSYFIKPENPVN
jgi:PBP1b-binding outer membrane lipoprotein LpoB